MQGRALIRDADLHRLSAAERARTVSVVLTERAVPPLMDVRSLVALGRQPRTDRFGALSASDRAHVEQALEQAGVQHLAGRALDACSDGERQKVMIARALAQEPALMILDEPTAFLDLPRRAEIMFLLRDLARTSGRAILLSTHDLDLALRTADRVWLLAHGRLTDGAPEDLVLSGAFASAFHSDGVTFNISEGAFHVERWISC